MSGHSKWATTKHQKAAKDKTRGKVFAKIIRQVEVAAREGGGDPESNPTLRTMFQKARDASIPMDTIEKAIKRGTGDLEGVRYESINYEGYGPGGVAIIVEVPSPVARGDLDGADALGEDLGAGLVLGALAVLGGRPLRVTRH